MLDAAPVLNAGAVRERLFDAIAPVWSAALAVLSDRGLVKPEEVFLLVQPGTPFSVQVCRRASDEHQAAQLFVVRGEALPDRGEALRAATLEHVAGVISGFPEDSAVRAVKFAQAVSGEGGFLLAVDPELGLTRLYLCRPGDSLETALDLGGIGEMQPTRAH